MLVSREMIRFLLARAQNALPKSASHYVRFNLSQQQGRAAACTGTRKADRFSVRLLFN